MITSIRGTNGSGKSTVVRAIMSWAASNKPIYGLLGSRRPEAYALVLVGVAHPIYVLGPYDVPTGGCDILRSAQVLSLLQKYTPRGGHVLFEGSLVGDHWGEVGEFLDTRRDETVVAFMSTSLEECLRRLAARRREAGNTDALDPANTEKRFKAVARTRRNFVEGRFRTMTLSDDRAAEEVLEVFREFT